MKIFIYILIISIWNVIQGDIKLDYRIVEESKVGTLIAELNDANMFNENTYGTLIN